MQQQYIDDPQFALHVRMIPALAFLPLNEVIVVFERLCDLLRERYDEVLDELTTLRILTLGDSEEIEDEDRHYFQSICGIYSNELPMRSPY